MILGGLVDGTTSVDTIFAGKPNKLRLVGQLPQPTHDAAATIVDGSVYLFGGGSTVSTANIVRISFAGQATNVGALQEPLSDLGAVTIIGRERARAYLVGGYTGYDSYGSILRIQPHGEWTVAQLPQGTRYPGVTTIGRTIYVAGGLAPGVGELRAVYAVPFGGRPRRIAKLPAREAHAGLAALNGTLYYIGGRKILEIDPATGKVTLAMKLPARLSDPSVVTVGDRIVIAGGGTRRIWAFTP
jgi:hypothetical protein